jgi:hypothetical protein
MVFEQTRSRESSANEKSGTGNWNWVFYHRFETGDPKLRKLGNWALIPRSLEQNRETAETGNLGKWNCPLLRFLCSTSGCVTPPPKGQNGRAKRMIAKKNKNPHDRQNVRSDG